MKEKVQTKSRPAATLPIHSVLDRLFDLFDRVRNHAGEHRDNNIVEKYDYFIRHSSRGRSCSYSLKCKALFELSDYEDIKDLTAKLVEVIREMPGEASFLKE